MKIPLEAVTDQELLTELARRKLDIHENVNESLVNETYEMGALSCFNCSFYHVNKH
jgi:hypothetical protein